MQGYYSSKFRPPLWHHVFLTALKRKLIRFYRPCQWQSVSRRSLGHLHLHSKQSTAALTFIYNDLFHSPNLERPLLKTSSRCSNWNIAVYEKNKWHKLGRPGTFPGDPWSLSGQNWTKMQQKPKREVPDSENVTAWVSTRTNISIGRKLWISLRVQVQLLTAEVNYPYGSTWHFSGFIL